MAWKTIETAPLDGTEVDIFVVDEDGRGERICDARYVRQYHEEYTEYAEDGSYSHKSRKRDGWWDPNAGYDRNGGFADYPRTFNPHPKQRREVFIEATHWMPAPPDPRTQKEPAQ